LTSDVDFFIAVVD